MSRKPVPAQSGDRSRAELVFDRPQLMAQLFGEFDQNLLALENKLGDYDHRIARGQACGSCVSFALLGGQHFRKTMRGLSLIHI